MRPLRTTTGRGGQAPELPVQAGPLLGGLGGHGDGDAGEIGGGLAPRLPRDRGSVVFP